MKVSVFKIYEKALSTFVVQKSKAIFKRAPNPSNGGESASVKGRTHKKASIYKMGEYKITEKNLTICCGKYISGWVRLKKENVSGRDKFYFSVLRGVSDPAF
jgi:hypothetical protein